MFLHLSVILSIGEFLYDVTSCLAASMGSLWKGVFEKGEVISVKRNLCEGDLCETGRGLCERGGGLCEIGVSVKRDLYPPSTGPDI